MTRQREAYMRTEEYKRSRPVRKQPPAVSTRKCKPPTQKVSMCVLKAQVKVQGHNSSRPERVNKSKVTIEEIPDEEAYKGPTNVEDLPYVLTDEVTDSEVFTKYKTVDQKVRLVKTTLPEGERIIRNITGDLLKEMPTLPTNPPEQFVLTGYYTEERKAIIDKLHSEEFLWPQERLLMHELMRLQEKAFTWAPEEIGTFKEEFFPPITFPVVDHELWVERGIPIPPGIFDEVCKMIKGKIDAGVYEPSNMSY